MGADNRPLAILGFHKVGKPSPGSWESWYYISQEAFLNNLKCLRDNDWHVIDAASFLRGLDDPDSLPDRAALLTFDVGYHSVFTVALPCLQEFGYPAISFVPTDFIGGTNTFDNGMEPEEAISGWDAL